VQQAREPPIELAQQAADRDEADEDHRGHHREKELGVERLGRRVHELANLQLPAPAE
jgi:hypothetical protein